MTPAEIARRQVRIENELEHRGPCERVFPTGVVCGDVGRLLKCQHCGGKFCFHCCRAHRCGGSNAS